MRRVGGPALAGGMPNPLPALQQCAHLDAVLVVDVQVEQHPAALLKAITVEVQHDLAVLAADHATRRRGRDPLSRGRTAQQLVARHKIERGAPAAVPPAPVRAAGKVPGVARLPRQPQIWLRQIGRHDRVHRVGEGIAKKALVGTQESTGASQPQPLVPGDSKFGQAVLHASGARVEPRRDSGAGAIRQAHRRTIAPLPAIVALVEPHRRPTQLLEQPLVVRLDVPQRIDERIGGGLGLGDPS